VRQRRIEFGIGVQLTHGLLGVRGLVEGRLEDKGVSGILWRHELFEAAVLTYQLKTSIFMEIQIIGTYRTESHYLFVTPCF